MSLLLVNPKLGAPVVWAIGRQGEPADLVPARISGQPFEVVTEQGRRVTMVPIIAQRVNQQTGEPYADPRDANGRYVFDRAELVEFLDGTEDAPKSLTDLIREIQANAMERLTSGVAGAATTMTVSQAKASAKA